MEDHIAFLDKRMAEQFIATQRERDLALAVLDKRIDALSAVAIALKEQQGANLTRREHELFVDQVNPDIRTLRESRAELAGKASQSALDATRSNVSTALVIAAVGALSGPVALLMAIFELVKGK
jgi:hypothetical protein